MAAGISAPNLDSHCASMLLGAFRHSLTLAAMPAALAACCEQAPGQPQRATYE